MKNYEKYADEIREYNGDSICRDFIEPYILKSINAKCINTSCPKCHLYRTIWLMEEYEEPEVDWGKVEVDTPILVKNSEDEEWRKRHFAKYKNGNVYAWSDGQTSWTAYDMMVWKYAKLSEDEEERKELEVDWSKVNVDTPILVGEGDGEWVKRYFAEYKDGIVYAWCGGSTSWDANNMMMSWKYAKLAENEETK